MQKQRSHITLTADGRILVTDNWAATGLNGIENPQYRNPHNPEFKNKNATYSLATPIGIVDHGILHGEEPSVSGKNGTGAVYIHGCPLKCSTCYQPEFFSESAKFYTDTASLVQLFLDYQRAGVDTVSLVIATYRPDVHQAIRLAKQQGLTVPVVYNYSGMLAPRVLSQLVPDVDIFVPDMKAVSDDLVHLHKLPKGYVDVAKVGIRFLIEQGANAIVRHLVVPHFNAQLEEVETIINDLNLSNTNVQLSLLIHYMDPATKHISTVDPQSLSKLVMLAAEKNVRLYFQGGKLCAL